MVASKPQKVGIFDIDGTIKRKSLLIELVDIFFERGVLPLSARQSIETCYTNWLNRTGSFDEYINAVVRGYMENLKGISVIVAEQIAEEIIASSKDHVYRYTRDKIRDLKNEGYILLAISGSPSYIVSRFAQSLGFHAAYGAEHETAHGLFTGNTINHDSVTDKWKVVQRFKQEYKISIDFEESVAVGDSESDVSILEVVGKPIAFNPSASLAAIAQQKNWPIVVERKNVVYEIHNGTITMKTS